MRDSLNFFSDYQVSAFCEYEIFTRSRTAPQRCGGGRDHAPPRSGGSRATWNFL